MPLYNYRCNSCDSYSEGFASIEDRNNQVCSSCGSNLELVIYKPQEHYKPFAHYFDIGLGVEVTSVAQRRRVMKETGMDFRDHPSPGDRTARLDRVNEAVKAEARRR